MMSLFVHMTKKILPSVLISFGFCWVCTLSPEEQVARSPREDACTSCVVTCPSSSELDSISTCICSINSKLTEDFQATWTAIAAIDCCWTFTIGEVFCDNLNTVPLIDAKAETIISWVKTLYALNRGLCDFQTP